MFFNPDAKCPYFKKPCLKHDCTHFVALRGINPQTGQDVDEWGCAIVWNVVAQLEGNKEMRQTAAAIESFRNEMVRSQQTALQVAENVRLALPAN